MGRYSDMVGVWTEPVIAQLMMILRLVLAIFGLEEDQGPNDDMKWGAKQDRFTADIFMSLFDIAKYCACEERSPLNNPGSKRRTVNKWRRSARVILAGIRHDFFRVLLRLTV